MPDARPPAICMLLRGDFTHNLRVRKQARTLVNAGWDVTVIALAVRGQPVGPEIDGEGFTVWRVRDSLLRKDAAQPPGSGQSGAPGAPGRERAHARSRLPRLLHLARLAANRVVVMFRMIRVIRRLRPDVVEAHNVNTLPAGYLGARMTGAVLMYDAHEINVEREGYYARIRPLIYRIEKSVVPRAALVMSTTDLRSEHYQETYHLPRKPLVIQNKPRFSAAERNDALRRACGIPGDRVIVLYQGGLQEGRGLHNLVRVAAKVEGAAFVFLGNGAQERSLRELAKSTGAAGKVWFHAAVPLDALPAFTAGADIGVQVLRNTCLNHYTTDSNKIFEYAMGGLAVVASDFPEIRRIVERYRYGILVDPGDIDDIAAAIQRLVRDETLREQLRANAVVSREALSWESQEDEYVAAVNALIRTDALA